MQYIVYRCSTCKRHFLLLEEEVTYSEEEGIYITCAYNGKHKEIKVIATDDSLKECLKKIASKDTYKRKDRRTVQSRCK